MSTLLSDPIFVILTLALLGSIGYNVWQVVYRNRAWKQVMADTSLQFEQHKKAGDRDQTLSGVYHRHKLTLADTNLPVYRNGKRKSDMLTNASTNLHVTLENPQGLKLILHRTTQIKKITPIGIEEFDDRFNTTCEPEDFAKTLLASASLREKLQQLKPGGLFELKENELVYDQTGRIMDAAEIIFLMDVTCSLADAIEAWRA
jgi:hypothetical protein